MDNPDTNLRAGVGQPSRRGLLRALGVGGAAGATGAFGLSARPATAQETTTTTSGTTTPGTTAPPVPTTTAPPAKPGPADLELVALAKQVELTIASGYAALTESRLAALGFDELTSGLMIAIGAHHRAYAEALSALHGPGSPDSPSVPLAAQLGTGVFANGDAATVLVTAQAIEEAAVDTHLSLLEALQSTNAAALVASIQIVEARHAAVLAHIQGQVYDASAPAAEDGADALTAADITGGS